MFINLVTVGITQGTVSLAESPNVFWDSKLLTYSENGSGHPPCGANFSRLLILLLGFLIGSMLIWAAGKAQKRLQLPTN